MSDQKVKAQIGPVTDQPQVRAQVGPVATQAKGQPAQPGVQLGPVEVQPDPAAQVQVVFGKPQVTATGGKVKLSDFFRSTSPEERLRLFPEAAKNPMSLVSQVDEDGNIPINDAAIYNQLYQRTVQNRQLSVVRTAQMTSADLEQKITSSGADPTHAQLAVYASENMTNPALLQDTPHGQYARQTIGAALESVARARGYGEGDIAVPFKDGFGRDFSYDPVVGCVYLRNPQTGEETKANRETSQKIVAQQHAQDPGFFRQVAQVTLPKVTKATKTAQPARSQPEYVPLDTVLKNMSPDELELMYPGISKPMGFAPHVKGAPDGTVLIKNPALMAQDGE